MCDLCVCDHDLCVCDLCVCDILNVAINPLALNLLQDLASTATVLLVMTPGLCRHVRYCEMLKGSLPACTTFRVSTSTTCGPVLRNSCVAAQGLFSYLQLITFLSQRNATLPQKALRMQ